MTVNQKAAQKAVKALILALGIPEKNLSRIELNCGGSVRVFTRDHASLQVAHVAPFETGAAK